MKVCIALVGFICLVAIGSCSWVNNFYIVNESSSYITLDVTLTEEKGFPIFFDGNYPHQMYELKNGSPDYNQVSTINKEKTNRPARFRLILPRNTAIQIGSLSNDTYTSHTQKFINDRVFNLKSIHVAAKNETFTITPEVFDQKLEKSNGDFLIRIKD